MIDSSLIKKGDYVIFSIRISSGHSTGIAKINRIITVNKKLSKRFCVTLIYCNKISGIDYSILYKHEIEKIIQLDSRLKKWLKLLYE